VKDRPVSDILILVNDQDNQIGSEEKQAAHTKGLLHRAFSLFILDENGDMLLQQRALDKYHSGGIWSNACCSHPRDGEDLETAVARRLSDELGISCEAEKKLEVVYKLDVGGGLIEHEYNHTFVAQIPRSTQITPHPEEVASVKWISLTDLEAELDANSDTYSSWFRLLYPKVKPHLTS